MARLKHLAAVSLFVTCASLSSPVLATSGWGKFRVDIDGDFRLSGVKSSHVMLERINANGQIIQPPIFSSITDPKVGFLDKYATTERYIVTRHWYREDGAKRQTNQSGDHYFVVQRADGVLTGPLTAAELANHAASQSGEFEWITPRAPGDSPVDDLLMAAIMFGPVVLPIVLLAVFAAIAIAGLVSSIRKNRRHRSERDIAPKQF